LERDGQLRNLVGVLVEKTAGCIPRMLNIILNGLHKIFGHLDAAISCDFIAKLNKNLQLVNDEFRSRKEGEVFKLDNWKLYVSCGAEPATNCTEQKTIAEKVSTGKEVENEPNKPVVVPRPRRYVARVAPQQ